MMSQATECDSIADQTAAALRKYLPDYGEAGGLGALTIRLSLPIRGKLFKGTVGPWEPVRVVVEIYPDEKIIS